MGSVGCPGCNGVLSGWKPHPLCVPIRPIAKIERLLQQVFAGSAGGDYEKLETFNES
jgi:hypothetical protein